VIADALGLMTQDYVSSQVVDSREVIFEGFGGQFKKMDINDPRLDTPESIKKVVMDMYKDEEE